MNVLILGSGGREHAIAWKLASSPLAGKISITPGNAGTALVGENVNVGVNDFEKIGSVALERNAGLVVVGPEEPLVRGIRDFFISDPRLRHIPVIGPSSKAAMLEGSKDYAKAFMTKYNIPTAAYRTFDKNGVEDAIRFLSGLQPPFVLKADGMAAGKGVILCQDREQAKEELVQMLTHSKFGKASEKVIIEEYLQGIEVSVFVLTDGLSYKILPSAKDYKRIGEGDTGPDTGGMGAVSGVPFAGVEFMEKVEKRIIQPTLKGIASEGLDYCGFIFLGLMNVQGDPYVIEYNVRLGDPETQSVLPRIQSDLLELLIAVSERRLREKEVVISPAYAATVVLASAGYPGNYEKNKVITGLEKVSGSLIFHAGTTQSPDGRILSSGGRVMAVTTLDQSLSVALYRSLVNARMIDFEGKYFRSDIGNDLKKYL